MADERPRFKLEFGGSVERKVGQAAIDPATFRDLRNVNLFAGKMGVRKGLTRTQLMADGTHVIAEHPLRGRAKLMVVTWNSGTAATSLWLCDHDGTNPFLITNTLITGGSGLGFVGAEMPRIIMADLYDRVFIAHDEPILWKRAYTQIFSFEHNRLLDPVFTPGDVAFTDETGASYRPKFRGVKRHLNYLVGWGFGAPNLVDPLDTSTMDRGEVLRISGPGIPTVFDARHYFLVGARGEPIIMCDPAANILLVKKPTENFKLNGYDRQTFGISPDVDAFGQVVSRLSVTVGGVNYFWSHAGPRRSNGGESVDLAVPLDLGGPAPDSLAASADAETAFACYDPDEREVIFCFGQWAYVLHLAEEPTLKWSFRKYAVALFAGVVSHSEAVLLTAGVPLGTVRFDTVTAPPVGFFLAGSDYLRYWIETLGTFGPWDSIEYWAKEIGVASAWHRTNIAFAERAYSANERGWKNLDAGMKYDLAVRIVRSAVPGATYTNANPALWPAAAVLIAHATAHTTLPVPVTDFDNPDPLVAFPPGYSYDPVSKMLFVGLDALPTGSDSFVDFDVDGADGVGGWTPLPVLSEGDSPVTAYGHNTPGHQILTIDATAMDTFTRDVRIRRKTVHDTTAYLTLLGVVFV